MLVVTRKIGESLVLQDKDTGAELARVFIASVDRNQVKVGVKAPTNLAIWRTELIETPDGTKRTHS